MSASWEDIPSLHSCAFPAPIHTRFLPLWRRFFFLFFFFFLWRCHYCFPLAKVKKYFQNWQLAVLRFWIRILIWVIARNVWTFSLSYFIICGCLQFMTSFLNLFNIYDAFSHFYNWFCFCLCSFILHSSCWIYISGHFFNFQNHNSRWKITTYICLKPFNSCSKSSISQNSIKCNSSDF